MISSFNFGGQNADPEIVRENFNKIARYLTAADACVLTLQSESADISSLGANAAIRNFTVFMSSDTANCDVTIPNPVIFALSVIEKKDTIFFFKGLSGAGTKTIFVNSGTIEGASSVTLANDQTICIQSNGEEYKILFDSTSMVGGSGDFVESVTGYNVNNTDPFNPVILPVQVDGTTITGSGVVGNPFVSGAGVTITADNGLTKTGSNIQLGGSLLANTSITGGAYTLSITGNPTTLLYSQNTGSGYGVIGESSSGTGVYGNSTTGAGVFGFGVPGVFGNSTSGDAGLFVRQSTSTNDVLSIVTIKRSTTGTAAIGIGSSIIFENPTDGVGGAGGTGKISNIMDNATGGSESSHFEFAVRDAGGYIPIMYATGQGVGVGQLPTGLFSVGNGTDEYIHIDTTSSVVTSFDATTFASMSATKGASAAVNIVANNATNTARLDVFSANKTVRVTGQLNLTTQFTPANSTDAANPNKTLSADDTYLYYRKSNGTWVKTPWQVF